MYKIFDKVLHIILNLIIVVVVLLVMVVAYNYFQLQIMGKDYTNLFGYTLFEVSTGSMANTLNIYDAIVIKITKDVEQNDIITYKQDDELITHRIIQINGNELTTKGDANNTEDKVITMDDVIGKVVFVCPKLGIWKKVFTDTRVLASVFITLILIGLATNKDIKLSRDNRRKRIKNECKEKEEEIL